MAVSQEDLDKKSEEIQKKRQQLADLQATRVSREQELTNEIAAAQMDAEMAKLDEAIASEKERSKVGAVKSGAENTLDEAAAAMASAALKPSAAKPPATKKDKE